MTEKSIRRVRFEKVAANRVQNILDYLDKLANCSNKNNYEYSDADVKRMFKEIKERLGHTESLFQGELKKSKKNTFTFK